MVSATLGTFLLLFVRCGGGGWEGGEDGAGGTLCNVLGFELSGDCTTSSRNGWQKYSACSTEFA